MQLSYKYICRVAFPVLMSLLVEYLIGLTDTAYLGRAGEVELGASALAGIYYLTIYMIGFGFSIGAQVLIARYNGEKAYKKIGDVFTQGVLFLLITAALLFILSHLFSPWILRQLIGSEEVYRATMSYLDWRSYGFFFSFVIVMFRAFYVGTTHTGILTANSIVMVLANVVLNYILIFGKAGMPALGIAGAAIASSVSEGISVLFFIIYTRLKVDYRKYGLFEKYRVDRKILKHVLGVSIWVMIQQGVVYVGWFVFFVTMEHLGERPLAITNIIRSISAFLFMFVQAFASTNSSLVGNLIGAGESGQVISLCRKVTGVCYGVLLPVIVLIALFPTAVLRIYTDNPELIAASVPPLWVMLSSYLFAVPAFVLYCAVLGTGNTRSSFAIVSFVLVVYVAYILWMAAAIPEVAWLWTADHVYYLGLILLAGYYMLRCNWRLKQL